MHERVALTDGKREAADQKYPRVSDKTQAAAGRQGGEGPGNNERVAREAFDDPCQSMPIRAASPWKQQKREISNGGGAQIKRLAETDICKKKKKKMKIMKKKITITITGSQRMFFLRER